MRAIYYAPDVSDREQAMVLLDWVRALQSYPGAFVVAAFEIWIDTNSRRPTPADISRLCRDMLSDARKRLRPREVPPERRELTEEERERRAAIANEFPSLKGVPQ